MAEIAGLLLDYGADVNARLPQMEETPLQALLSAQLLGGPAEEEAPAVELLTALLERGADQAGDMRGTALWRVLDETRSGQHEAIIPIAETLLRYGADVFAVAEPWQHEAIFDQIGVLQKKGQTKLAALIAQYGQGGRAPAEHAARRGVAELLDRLRNADEKALSVLNEELPWAFGLDWLRMGRAFQEELGPALNGLGKIDQLRLRGDWAETLLPTGCPGGKANVYVVLMRFPGGAYHAVQAGFTDTRVAGTRLLNPGTTHRSLMNAVYWSLGRSDLLQGGGTGSSEYPRQFGLLSITCEHGGLVIRPRDSASWIFSRADLVSDEVLIWHNDWDLNRLRRMTLATDDRKLLLADGALTVQHGEKTVVFRRHENQVQLQGDREQLAPAFVLDLQALAVK
jgi:hypothetical protein